MWLEVHPSPHRGCSNQHILQWSPLFCACLVSQSIWATWCSLNFWPVHQTAGQRRLANEGTDILGRNKRVISISYYRSEGHCSIRGFNSIYIYYIQLTNCGRRSSGNVRHSVFISGIRYELLIKILSVVWERRNINCRYLDWLKKRSRRRATENHLVCPVNEPIWHHARKSRFIAIIFHLGKFCIWSILNSTHNHK